MAKSWGRKEYDKWGGWVRSDINLSIYLLPSYGFFFFTSLQLVILSLQCQVPLDS